MVKKGGKVLGVRLAAGERRFDIGNFESYFQAFCEFALADARYGESLRAHIRKLLGGQDSPQRHREHREHSEETKEEGVKR
jgi:UTP--glucose-1-phosphate uridylyltransferase